MSSHETMSRRIILMMTLLAWCCLAVPWLVCESDCHDGSVQLPLHSCHSVAHHSCGTVEEDRACHAGVEHDGDICEDHDTELHQTLVFQQTTPDPLESPDLDRALSDVVDYPWAVECLAVETCSRSIDQRVDPPGFEVQALLQLRTDVLLR